MTIDLIWLGIGLCVVWMAYEIAIAPVIDGDDP